MREELLNELMVISEEEKKEDRTMKKRLLIRSLIGLVAGAMMAHLFTLLSNQLTKGVWLLCMPGLTEEIGFVGAVILQTVLGALFGAVAFGGICFKIRGP